MKLDLILTDLNELEIDGSYRFHLAKTDWKESEDGWLGYHPLEALTRGDEEWKGWQYWKKIDKNGKIKDRFPAKYIISFAQVSGDRFLFGGIFEVKARYERHYDVELTNHHKDLIGRLVIRCEGGTGRNTAFRPSLIEKLEMTEIYPTRYDGEVFKSINLINHTYESLETIFKNELSDWKSALSKVKGIYLLSDKNTGKNYVGSAYGEGGRTTYGDILVGIKN